MATETDFKNEDIITVLQLFVSMSDFDSTGQIKYLFVEDGFLILKLKAFYPALKTDKHGEDLENEVCRFITKCYLSRPFLNEDE